MKSVMTNQEYFNKVQQPQVQRSKFDRSSGLKTTFNVGYIYPIFVDEALPGDTFNMNANFFGRLSTPLKPIMDNMYIDIHFWSVPNRLVWDNWQKFNGEQDNPGDSTNFIMPTTTSPAGGYSEASLHDYMGIPTKIAGLTHRADFLRAYALIWDKWYRDENLVPQYPNLVPKGDGPDNSTFQILLPRGKRKDYFTSALPFPQKGTAVSIPIGTRAPVLGIGKETQSFPSSGLSFYQSNGSSAVFPFSASINPASANTNYHIKGTAAGSGYPDIYADLSAATAATINQLREAFQIQRMYEKDARGGTRYTEMLRAHFGVISPDARLQRPEYLGGKTINLNVNPIAQTSATVAGGTPQGNLSAMGTMSGSGCHFNKSFTEHEIIIGVASARADLNYQQGLNRMWSRSTRFDFYWPTLAHLGEQAILNKEIYAQGSANPTQDAAVFGYQERYAEYRYKPSLVTAQFRSNSALTLDSWHLTQKFNTLPALNASFIQENPPIDRILAVSTSTSPAFLLDCYFKLICARPMPTFSVPGFIDHF